MPSRDSTLPSPEEMSAVKFTVRLYPQRDADLLRFLDQLRNGEKNRVIKEMLRRGMQCEQSAVDLEAIRQVMQDTMGKTKASIVPFDLADIRKVVEAAVASALTGLEAPPSNSSLASGEVPKETPEVTEMLDSLGKSLRLEDQ